MLQSKLLLNFKNLSHFFFDGSDSTQIENFGINKDEYIYPNQIHSERIIFVNKIKKRLYNCDGLITQQKIGLCIKTADCLPILFYETNQKIIGAVHAGWRGVYLGIVTKVISEIILLGGIPSRIMIAVGPHIKECCYEVSKDLVLQFSKICNDKKCIEYRDSRIFLNLDKVVLSQTAKFGVPRKNIDILDYCTYHNKQFLSFRRDKTKDRMKNIIKFN